jgi:hypothetical protein
MTQKVLNYVLAQRGWDRLPCSHCGVPIAIGDSVVSHGQRPTRRRRYVRIYHEECFEKTRDCSVTLVKDWCPVCRRYTMQDTQKWETYRVCTECEVLIPWER